MRPGAGCAGALYQNRTTTFLKDPIMSDTTTPTNTEATAAQPTDKEKLEALFNELGIGFKPCAYDPNSITCSEGDAKIEGYNGFYTDFCFDEAGMFIKMDIGE